MFDVTIAICTWNREHILNGTLLRVLDLDIPPGLKWEVLVVDNNSSDGTPAVVKSYMGQLPVRYIHEHRQGIAWARNAAVGAAAGKLFIFLDDDCRPDRNLVAEYCASASAYPHVSIFGGKLEPDFEQPPPNWVLRNLDLLETIFPQMNRPGPNRLLGPTESVLSGNMAARYEVLRTYPFNTALGRVGKGREGGEEIDFYKRAISDGHSAFWVGTAQVRHFIPKELVTLDYIYRTSFGVGRYEFHHDDRIADNVAKLFGLPRWAIRKYIQSTIVKYLLPTRSRYWLASYIESARTRCIIQEAWAKSRRRG